LIPHASPRVPGLHSDYPNERYFSSLVFISFKLLNYKF
jgi:hypothetical protein